jgi:serine/threonine protein kinase
MKPDRPRSSSERPSPATTETANSHGAHDGATVPPVNTGVPAGLVDHPRYRILEQIGAGGMGTVYKAEHRVMERVVALKVISPALTAVPGAVERFHREVKAAARLSHPNIVTAYDAEQAGDCHFLVMEFVTGTNLATVVRQRGPLPVGLACGYIRQVALGLQHAFEQGMVHRDIKPHNLMLTSGGRVKILDFGLARFASETTPALALTQASQIMGTPDYMAPEQATDARSADIRADLYSLGCSLYHLVAGRPPFADLPVIHKLMAHLECAPEPITAFEPSVPPGLVAVLDRLLAKDPARRYQTPAEVARALGPFVTGAAASKSAAKEPSPQAAPAAVTAPTERSRPSLPRAASRTMALTPGSRRSSKDRKVLLAIAAAGLIVLIGLACFVAYRLATRAGSSPEAAASAPLAFSPGPAPAEPKPTLREGRARPKAEFVERTFAGHTQWVTGVAFSPDGLNAVSGGPDGSIRLWELASGQEAKRLDNWTQAISLAFLPDGERLLVGGWSHLYLWDVKAGQMLWDIPAHEGGLVTSVAVSPGGHRALSAGADRTIRYWDLDGRKELHTLGTKAQGEVWAVAISPDGRQGLSGATDGIIRLWDLEGGKEVLRFAGHASGIRALAYFPNGRQFISGSSDHTVRVWDVKGGPAVQTLTEQHHWIGGVAGARDNRHVVIGTWDRGVRWWDSAGKSPTQLLGEHEAEVLCVAISPDGQYALSGGKDNKMHLWRLPPSQ